MTALSIALAVSFGFLVVGALGTFIADNDYYSAKAGTAEKAFSAAAAAGIVGLVVLTASALALG